MREFGRTALLLLCTALSVQVSMGQTNVTSSVLHPGLPIERTLAGGQSHSYTIGLDKDQFVQLVVEQHGIDVVIRTFSPSGQRLGEFDSPNGSNGPEPVTITAGASGQYRIEVALLEPRDVQPGRYEVRIVEIRKATEQELKAARSQELLKAKGLALLLEVTQAVDQFHRVGGRAAMQIRAAQLLWAADETKARRLMLQAIDNVKEIVAKADSSDPNYFQVFQSAMQLRQQVIDALASRDPESALDFLRSTRTLVNPEGPRGDAQNNRELQLELTIASRIAGKDPKQAFRLAEDTLKEGASRNLIDTLQQLGTREPELASKLSHDIAAKLANEDWLQHPEAANLAVSFLQTNRPARTSGTSPSLVAESEYRDLFKKVITEALSYSVPYPNSYTPERNSAQVLLNSLRSMSVEVQNYAAEHAAAIERKWQELNNNSPLQGYSTFINNAPIDAALDAVSRAPADVKDQLYQQVASRVANTGDMPRARQIITEHITSLQQLQQALRNLDRQGMYNAISAGKLDDALRSLSDFRPANERAQMLIQFVNRIGQGIKKPAAITYLDQVRNMLGASARAEDQQQMSALFGLARAFSRYDSNRAFGVVEPLIDQFNDMAASASVLNGFGQKYYEDGDVIVDNGNPVGNAGNELANTLGGLALTDFERAKTAADQIRPADIRIGAYMAIAEQAIESTPSR